MLTRRELLVAAGTGVLVAGCGGPDEVELPADAVDLIVYGATPAGLAAAIQMRRLGGSVVVLEPSRHVGGMATSGLGATDVGDEKAIGGIAAEFYRRAGGYTFQPHVASRTFEEMLSAEKVVPVLGARLGAVTKRHDRIVSLVTSAGTRYSARMFVDASYEGDLMAAAGVSFVTGREGNARFGETLNGVQLARGSQFDRQVDPYVRSGSPASGLLPGISTAEAVPDGTADDSIQAYNFRMCLSRAEDRIRFTKPDEYDPLRYELLLRHIRAGNRGPFFTTVPVGGGKTDSNNKGLFSTDLIGGNHGYPTGPLAERDRITADHRSYQQGFFWFLANDPRVPEPVRTDVGAWGLAADEFTATGGWPPQLYVREARRMTSTYVMTEHDCRGEANVSDSVGLASYAMDSHHCRRLVVGGTVTNEGHVLARVRVPYRISYRSIVPLERQCANLLVPVALSASHVAYGSIRMEPVFMILGQSAATAAHVAIRRRTSVQRVPVPALQKQLRSDGQYLTWTREGPR